MPTCFQEGNTATEGSDTRRSMIKLANIGAKNVTPPPDEPTAIMTVIGPNNIVPSISSVIIRITMSAERLVDTNFTISSENENAMPSTQPVVILAGATIQEFDMSALVAGVVGPFEVSAVADGGVTVLNSVTLIMDP